MFVNGDLEVLVVLAELGLELACTVGAGVAEVGLDGEEEVAALEALGAVLRDGDLEVGVEADGELVLHQGTEEDDRFKQFETKPVQSSIL